MEENTYHLDKLMPRLSRLSETLERLEVENDIIFSLERAPGILTVLENRKIWMEYEMVEPDRDLLTMTVRLEISEMGERNMELLCEVFNKKSLFGTAVFEPLRNQVIFRCGVLEPDRMMKEEDLPFILKLFTDSVQRFEENNAAKEEEG